MGCVNLCRQFHLYRPHDPVGLQQNFEDALIVLHVREGQGAAFAILEPFLGGLIAADVEIP